MTEDLLVATRKGLFAVDSAGAEGAPRCLGFLGDPVSAVLHDRRDGTLYAALNLGHFGSKLHRSEDFGATWKELPLPAFAQAAPGNGADAPSVTFIWTLEPGGDDQAGRLWAGTLPGALFRSDDRGETWQLVEALWNQPSRSDWFGGGYDEPGIHSIVVDPRDSRRLTVGISCGGVWLSEDDGATWQIGGKGLAADYMPPDRRDDPSIQDPHRLAFCAAAPETLWCQHHCGIFRSDDGGRTFVSIDNVRPSGFGFAVAAHPADPKTAWFVPAVKDECRVPVDGCFVVTRTRDGGDSFETLTRGLPETTAFDLVYRHAFSVDDRGERLAMGSTTGALWLGRDGGESWSLLSGHLPPINQVVFCTA
ncbi:exo-alpha-sialidase [Pelagibius litoralis]|uniref:Exo-alpha-sialidase n=1 Tax=Pelagibius litoralis TaxID=374515 RepID=A0A967C3E8_9PROT|nr:sialidase family protein [Pelagibius litoralis]NIA67515.1 exo-alpha-sialidase [Pelagibius litoralis]